MPNKKTWSILEKKEINLINNMIEEIKRIEKENKDDKELQKLLLSRNLKKILNIFWEK